MRTSEARGVATLTDVTLHAGRRPGASVVIQIVCVRCGRACLGGDVWAPTELPTNVLVARVLCPDCMSALADQAGLGPHQEAYLDDSD